MKITIRQLADCPEFLDTVGNWIYHQWWQTPDNTSEVVLSLLRQHTVRDAMPFTLVALADGIPVGSCCVIAQDCAHRPQYTPWVAAVLVLDHRGRLHRGH